MDEIGVASKPHCLVSLRREKRVKFRTPLSGAVSFSNFMGDFLLSVSFSERRVRCDSPATTLLHYLQHSRRTYHWLQVALEYRDALQSSRVSFVTIAVSCKRNILQEHSHDVSRGILAIFAIHVPNLLDRAFENRVQEFMTHIGPYIKFLFAVLR